MKKPFGSFQTCAVTTCRHYDVDGILTIGFRTLQNALGYRRSMAATLCPVKMYLNQLITQRECGSQLDNLLEFPPPTCRKSRSLKAARIRIGNDIDDEFAVGK